MPGFTWSTKAAVGSLLATAVALSGATPAHADEDPSLWGINGTFATSSNGAFAKLNERYEAQPGNRATWTITTRCVGPSDCTGTVKSSDGWTAPIYTTDGIYFVKRSVPNWRYCDDGTAIQGFQEYKIYPVAPDGRLANLSDEYAGEDHTMGPSGSCGRNQWPVVRMPFYMKKVAG
ncbi:MULTISPECIES: hypothetical protein [Mycobacteriaceae]|uniref:Secreted protein n=1 Tax=Mycolicibacterium mucogenicum DSM 44124 TaxID=1226753 RepID=A0A8H2JA76_MYCMU|nr:MULTISPECIES: hypothetical protein [Mycobacteriaceae]KAB7754020.1 hypothetical protein MMUC44124_22625 [Mycolicibacterium mucogenicum DSM 44124]QPG70798.1 hypothetical protein C1S78_007530 [Mycolicibacterium mucogenicum DSM 44124]